MEALVRLYERPIYNAAYRMLGNREDAADVAQTTFMKAFQNLAQFNPAFRFFSWIYRIAMNEAINQLSRRRQTEALPETSPANEPGPADAADAGLVNREVQAVLMDLSEDYRSVIVLKYFSGCSYREMADILDIPEKTVKSRLFTARQRMKAALEQHGIFST